MTQDSPLPPHIEYANELAEFITDKWPTHSPMQHVMGLTQTIFQISHTVQARTETFNSQIEIQKFLTEATGRKAINAEYPIIEWTPAKEARLPQCANPDCPNQQELNPTALDADGPDGRPTIYANCPYCQTPHMIKVIEEN